MNSKFLRKMQTMDQFSHDLTIALEETSRSGGVHVGRWGQRRRTRSTGNLPCAPQPTEDSSSSPTDAANEIQNAPNQDGLTNSVLSDSDDRQDLRLSLKSRHAGNFESDSLNENFSPARPNTRRKRKFKRMAVEYETTPSTPGAAGENANNPVFPISGTVKKRVLKHTTQENYRTNLFFCGKRKRSHRDRYYDHDHGKSHSSSVPRQRDVFMPKNSYQEHKTRTRSFSSGIKPSCDRILPLNKSIVSKIERISQQQRKPESVVTAAATSATRFTFAPVLLNSTLPDQVPPDHESISESSEMVQPATVQSSQVIMTQSIPEDVPIRSGQQNIQKSTCLTTNFNPSLSLNLNLDITRCLGGKQNLCGNIVEVKPVVSSRRKHKHSRLRREHLRAQFQFDDPNSMECGGLNDFLSSSSLSSSDSEAGETNESDREGDDELTDWPGNEAMINFASKNDFKRKLTKKSNLPQIKSDDYPPGGDDDTLMSGDEVTSPPGGINLPLPLLTKVQSQPITIASSVVGSGTSSQQFRFPVKQIESEMSGETSNHFLSSPPCQPGEIREIRAGCRRIREERPGFTIMTSVNERLARFLQDARQTQIRLPDMEIHEHESLSNLAKLYSLQMSVDNGCAVLTKTSNTTQSVKIDQPNFGSRFLLSDFKRRCYDGRSGSSAASCDQENIIDIITTDSKTHHFKSNGSHDEEFDETAIVIPNDQCDTGPKMTS